MVRHVVLLSTAVGLPVVRIARAVLRQALAIDVAHRRRVVHQEALAHALDRRQSIMRRCSNLWHRPRRAVARRRAAPRAAEGARDEEGLRREIESLSWVAGHVGTRGARHGHVRGQPHLLCELKATGWEAELPHAAAVGTLDAVAPKARVAARDALLQQANPAVVVMTEGVWQRRWLGERRAAPVAVKV